MPDLTALKHRSRHISFWAVVGIVGLFVHAAVQAQQTPPRRLILFVVDDLNLDFRDTPRIRALVRKMGQQLIRERDEFGIVSTGPSPISIDQSSDLTRLIDASNQITGNGLRPAEIVQMSSAGEAGRRASRARQTMLDLLRRVQTPSDRVKAVVLISDGWDVDRLADTTFATGLDEIAQLITSTSATLHTIYPRGVLSGQGTATAVGVDPEAWAAHMRREQDSLRLLAERTGGLAAFSVDDYSSVVERISRVP